MAELITKNKRNTRIDLTPMVDLGFLLITFFVFTTTMMQPTAMKLILPKEGPDQPIPQSAALTLIPAKDNLIYYYQGSDYTKLQTADFHSIRDVIIKKKNSTNPKWFEVILKPTKDATYKNTVDILDEMKIDAVPHYALVDITPVESGIIQSTEHANGIP
jgi:biopolymer transport protein ExbD